MKRAPLDVFATLGRVRSVTMRDVAGDGVQADLTIATDRGVLTLRLVARQPIRLLDLRARDRKRRQPFVSVPMCERGRLL